LFFAGIIVIAANAGGAWSPIGDVTTTMLWIGGQITALEIVKGLFLPSLTNLLVPLLVTSVWLKGQTVVPPVAAVSDPSLTSNHRSPTAHREAETAKAHRG